MPPPQGRRSLRAHRRHPHRRLSRTFSCSPEPPSVASSRMGKPLRRVRSRTDRRRSPAEAARLLSASRKPNTSLRRGRERVAQMRRGVQSRAWSLLPTFPPLDRPADRGRMGLSVPPTLNFVGESWTAPVDVERVRPAQDANEVAAEQVKALLRLPHEYEKEEESAAPLFVFDAGYDPVKVQQGLKGTPCQILIRLRAGRFYADPSLASPPAHTGRPRRHGPKTKCSDPSTWPQPSTGYTFEDSGYGTVRVRAWAKLHPKVCSHEGRGSWGPLPIVVGTLVLVEAERLPRGETEHGTDHTSGVRHPEQADR